VRERELACRIGWALDLWERGDGAESGAVARVVGLRVWGPFRPGTAPDELPGDLLGWLARAAETECGEAGRRRGGEDEG
jgi:hypothetical protein